MSDLVAALEEAVRAGIAQRYVSAAGFIVLTYDILITLDDEIRLIWKAPWTVSKALFLINRYVVPASMLLDQWMLSGFAPPMTHDFCVRYLLGFQTVQNVEGAGVISVMLLIRVYALYQRRLVVLISLLLLACLPLITTVVVSDASVVVFQDGIVFLPELNTCAVTFKPSYLWVTWLSLIIFDTTIFVMIVFKTWRQTTIAIATPVLYLLLRDGAFYFVIMLFLEVCCLITYVILSADWYFIGTYLTWSLHSLLVSRIYLNLRDVRNHRDWTNITNLKDSVIPVEEQQRAAAIRHQQERRNFHFDDLEDLYELDEV